MKQTNVSVSSHRIAHNHPTLDDTAITDTTDILLCRHNDYCILQDTINKPYCTLQYAENCQTHKYYNKYGDLRK